MMTVSVKVAQTSGKHHFSSLYLLEAISAKLYPNSVEHRSTKIGLAQNNGPALADSHHISDLNFANRYYCGIGSGNVCFLPY